MINITVKQLIQLGALQENAEKYAKPLSDTCNRFNINTKARICAFLAQIFEESGKLSVVRENLFYSSAQRLMKVWPTRFPTVESTNGCLGNPAGLADRVYQGRGGNNLPSDGHLYSGKGLIQLTFKDTYKECGKDLVLDLIGNPDLLLQPEYAALSAGWFWNKRNLNQVADSDNENAVKQATYKVNGAYGNLDSRMKYWHIAKTIDFGSSDSVVAVVATVVEPVMETDTPVVEQPAPEVSMPAITPNEVQIIPIAETKKGFDWIGFILSIFKRKQNG